MPRYYVNMWSCEGNKQVDQTKAWRILRVYSLDNASQLKISPGELTSCSNNLEKNTLTTSSSTSSTPSSSLTTPLLHQLWSAALTTSLSRQLHRVAIRRVNYLQLNDTSDKAKFSSTKSRLLFTFADPTLGGLLHANSSYISSILSICYLTCKSPSSWWPSDGM
jgi:hypothetical protein